MLLFLKGVVFGGVGVQCKVYKYCTFLIVSIMVLLSTILVFLTKKPLKRIYIILLGLPFLNLKNVKQIWAWTMKTYDGLKN